ncbi:MAG TPA: hypothetical protein H9867_01240 [Candidatus Corynebacterium gallistercoris]|uniref:Signal transduction histidine kinase subgroup 3 dimerisation and phosphoacceptor domain-containing protein n=1 Tax=Candidatus Corynebacterium gallistercoris TaxID=2838530 RepID=A0A9D1RVT8_9CORY|nr:hypothetical protein [Candidatus Corynebacterium gallistercoris]
MNPFKRSPAVFARTTQLSLIFVLFVQLLVPVIAYGSQADTWTHNTVMPLVVMTLAGLPAAALGIVTLLLMPQLNIHPQRDVRPYFRLGVLASIAYALAGIGVYAMPGAGGTANWENQHGWHWMGLLSAYAGAVILSWGFLPWVRGRWVWVALVTVFVYVFTDRELGWVILIIPALGVGCGLFSQWTIDVVKDLDRARDTEATLRISQERLRIAQQLHDSLGQNLAAISLKAQLARAFAAQQDPRLDGELETLQEIVARSVDDMRQVVQGYRTLDVATELAHARGLLQDMGVAVHVQGAPEDIPVAHQDIVGWFVREATTNIVRHSQASRADFKFTPVSVLVVNDGATGPVGKWGGLDSLRRRHEITGGTLTARTPEKGRFEVEMALAEGQG